MESSSRDYERPFSLNMPPQDLWSSILNSVSSSRSIPANNVFVLQLAKALSCLLLSKSHLPMPAMMSHAQTLHQDTTGPIYAMREKVCYPLNPPEPVPHPYASHVDILARLSTLLELGMRTTIVPQGRIAINVYAVPSPAPSYTVVVLYFL